MLLEEDQNDVSSRQQALDLLTKVASDAEVGGIANAYLRANGGEPVGAVASARSSKG